MQIESAADPVLARGPKEAVSIPCFRPSRPTGKCASEFELRHRASPSKPSVIKPIFSNIMTLAETVPHPAPALKIPYELTSWIFLLCLPLRARVSPTRNTTPLLGLDRMHFVYTSQSSVTFFSLILLAVCYSVL
jgi:hypothetical protein